MEGCSVLELGIRPVRLTVDDILFTIRELRPPDRSVENNLYKCTAG